jgi:phage terminase large subunit-like protein
MDASLACPDWWERLQAGKSPFPDLKLNKAKADRAAAIYYQLRLPDVPGKPFIGDEGEDWFGPIVKAIFGAVQGDGRRRIGELFCMVPKKNGKTTKAAALSLVSLLLNERPKADMLLIGPTQKISDTAFQQARGMIEADEFLSARLHVREHLKTIECRVTGARLMIRTFGMDVLTGAKPVLAILDEVHLLGSVSYAADVIRQIRGGMLPFDESLFAMITTQSDHPPAGVFKSELQYARGVRDGAVADGVRVLPVLYEFPEALQRSEEQVWKDQALWHMVTPSLGRSLTMDRLTEGWQRAQHDGVHEIIGWATQHLNVEVGMALHTNRWAGADLWLAAGREDLTLETLLERSEVVVAGIDGGGLDDLMALAVIGRDRETRQWLHWAHAWCHPAVLERRKDIAPKLQDLVAVGDLTICSKPTQDVIELADHVERLHQSGLLPERGGVGLDPWGITALVDEIASRGVPDEVLVNVTQGARLSSAVWGAERKLNDGTFSHGGQPLMAWAIGNAIAEQRGNAVIITKATAGKAKIDPLMATFNAVELMSRNPQAGVQVPLSPWDVDPDYTMAAL